MSRALFICLLLAALALSGCAHPQQPAPPAPTAPEPTKPAPSSPPPHLRDAELLLSQLEPQDTNYQHRPVAITFKTAPADRAQCRADCSAFAAAMLQHAYSLSDADLKSIFGSTRPVARSFVSAIESARRFTPIAHVQDAQPGDFIAIRYPKDANDTGHVMILAAPPRPRDPTPPLIANTNQWDLDVIDSTSSPHSNDSRHPPGSNPRSGAGRGTFRLYTDSSGTPVGHTWSDSQKSTYRQGTERHLVIGHYIQ